MPVTIHAARRIDGETPVFTGMVRTLDAYHPVARLARALDFRPLPSAPWSGTPRVNRYLGPEGVRP